MDARRTPRAVVAWSSAAVTGVLEVSALGLAAADGAGIAGVGPVAGALAVGVMLSAVAVVGALVVGQRPDSPIGWLLLVLAGLASVGSAAEAYGVYSLGNPTAGLPAGAMAAWVSSWILTPSWYAIPGLLLLLFPDGRLPHRRWRWVAWLLVGATMQPAHVSLWQPTGRPADPLWTGGVAPESTVDEGLAAGVAQGLP